MRRILAEIYFSIVVGPIVCEADAFQTWAALSAICWVKRETRLRAIVEMGFLFTHFFPKMLRLQCTKIQLVKNSYIMNIIVWQTKFLLVIIEESLRVDAKRENRFRSGSTKFPCRTMNPKPQLIMIDMIQEVEAIRSVFIFSNGQYVHRILN
jgi:hypothetical protein